MRDFDHIFYLGQYSDLVHLKTREKAYEHWVKHGSKEGRQCLKPIKNRKPSDKLEVAVNLDCFVEDIHEHCGYLLWLSRQYKCTFYGSHEQIYLLKEKGAVTVETPESTLERHRDHANQEAIRKLGKKIDIVLVLSTNFVPIYLDLNDIIRDIDNNSIFVVGSTHFIIGNLYAINLYSYRDVDATPDKFFSSFRLRPQYIKGVRWRDSEKTIVPEDMFERAVDTELPPSELSDVEHIKEIIERLDLEQKREIFDWLVRNGIKRLE